VRFNTTGKPDKLGEQIKCVVSVSMLTEGWDANTVTHILGVRAFGTQLLCEQVVGRGLRRMSFALDENGRIPARTPWYPSPEPKPMRNHRNELDKQTLIFHNRIELIPAAGRCTGLLLLQDSPPQPRCISRHFSFQSFLKEVL
jgi:hypothetical protein